MYTYITFNIVYALFSCINILIGLLNLGVSANKTMLHSFTLLHDHFCEELSKLNINVTNVCRLFKNFCICCGVSFNDNPTTMDGLLEVMLTMPFINFLNLKFVDMLADKFKIKCLKNLIHNYIKAYSSLSLKEAISRMPEVVRDVKVVLKDRHINFRLDELTVAQLLGNKAKISAYLDKNILSLYPAVQLASDRVSLPNYIAVYVQKHLANSKNCGFSHHLTTIYMHLGNYKIDVYYASKGKDFVYYICISQIS